MTKFTNGKSNGNHDPILYHNLLYPQNFSYPMWFQKNVFVAPNLMSDMVDSIPDASEIPEWLYCLSDSLIGLMRMGIYNGVLFVSDMSIEQVESTISISCIPVFMRRLGCRRVKDINNSVNE
jgi:hypothetical protein